MFFRSEILSYAYIPLDWDARVFPIPNLCVKQAKLFINKICVSIIAHMRNKSSGRRGRNSCTDDKLSSEKLKKTHPTTLSFGITLSVFLFPGSVNLETLQSELVQS